MEIRRYKRGEERAVWEVYFAATRESIARDYHAELIERWAPHDQDMSQWAERLARKNPFVAIVDKEIVGMAEIEMKGFINYFYVHPAWQSRGIGKALLATLESEAAKFGVSVILGRCECHRETLFPVERIPRDGDQIEYHPWPSGSEFQNAKDTEQRTRRRSECGCAASLTSSLDGSSNYEHFTDEHPVCGGATIGRSRVAQAYHQVRARASTAHRRNATVAAKASAHRP